MNVQTYHGGADARAIEECARVLAANSKSFALAAKLLPRGRRSAIAVIYAFCRRVDDAIDLVPVQDRAAALAHLRSEVDAVFQGRSTGVVVLDAFAAVARAHRIPREYVDELIEGMAMDVDRVPYETLDALYLYAYRVAGVVGLMLCHVMGLSDARALPTAAHLGMAMQITNVCRDVDEDLEDSRCYLPRELLGFDLRSVPLAGSTARDTVARTVRTLLDDADKFYRSADRGIDALPFRCALAVRAARYIYAAIGDELRDRGCDPFLGRSVVSYGRKLTLVARAVLVTVARAFRRVGGPAAPPTFVLAFADVARHPRVPV